MTSKNHKQKITFVATKIVSKPSQVSFTTKSGKVVIFKAQKDIPESIRVTFLAKKPKK